MSPRVSRDRDNTALVRPIGILPRVVSDFTLDDHAVPVEELPAAA
jgi:hypothetical protein